MHIILLLLIIFIGCQPHEDAIQSSKIFASDDQEKAVVGKDPGKEQGEKIDKKNQKINVRRAQFSEKNWIDFTIIQTSANIKAYAPEFERIATIDFSLDHGGEIDTKKDLQDFCHKNLYETNKEFEGLIGYIDLFVNPLSWHLSRMIAGFFLRETVTEVENPFKISKKHVEIEADFLDQSEKNLIIENGAFKMFDEMDFLRVHLFHPWAGPGKITSSVIVRLFCGIADGKASILYVFNDDKNQDLRVRINSVNFKLLNY